MTSSNWYLLLPAIAVLYIAVQVLRHEITTRAAKKADRARDDEEKLELEETAQFFQKRELLPGNAVAIYGDDMVYYLDSEGNLVIKTVKDFRDTVVALETLGKAVPRAAILNCAITPHASWSWTCGSARWGLRPCAEFPETLVDHSGCELKVVLNKEAREFEYFVAVLRIMEAHNTVTEYASAYRMRIADERIASTRNAFRSPALAEARGLLQNKSIKPFSEGHLPNASLLVGVI